MQVTTPALAKIEAQTIAKNEAYIEANKRMPNNYMIPYGSYYKKRTPMLVLSPT